MKKLLLFAIVILGFSAASFAQPGVSIVASSTAKIIEPISISNVASEGLSFGTIAKGTTGGTVSIAGTEAGDRTKLSGGLTLSTIDEGRSAKFTVSGESNSTFTITLPESDNVEFGANTMGLSNFRYNGSSSNTGSLTLDGTTLDVYVGATLTIGASQAVGTYSGDFEVTVNYN